MLRSFLLRVMYVFGLIAALAATELLTGSSSVTKARPNEAIEHPTQVATAVVGVRPMPRYLALTGTLIANQSSQVAADGMGRVQKTFVERGGIDLIFFFSY